MEFSAGLTKKFQMFSAHRRNVAAGELFIRISATDIVSPLRNCYGWLYRRAVCLPIAPLPATAKHLPSNSAVEQTPDDGVCL